ncbi:MULTISPECIES: hypothetical protein [Bacillus cereus group]|uniref:hypothetical protein n=2 Tax=Bacillus cereus group TaxID=86661 RepID=UPI001E41928A|nr:hypothetical protein [Bacillus cereus]
MLSAPLASNASPIPPSIKAIKAQIMNFKEYQTTVTRTFATGRAYEQNSTNYAMELCGEVGEVRPYQEGGISWPQFK